MIIFFKVIIALFLSSFLSISLSTVKLYHPTTGEKLFTNPQHDYTKQLIASVPQISKIFTS